MTSSDSRVQRKLELRARTFRYNDQLERLSRDPQLLAKMPPTKRMAVGHYVMTREAAEAVGIDVSAPAKDAA